MNDTWHRLRTTSDVSGFILHNGATVLESWLNQDLDSGISDGIGNIMNRFVSGAHSAGVMPKVITFFFDSYIFVSTNIRNSLSLSVICGRKINLTLLEIALNMTLAEIAKKEEKPPADKPDERPVNTIERIMQGNLNMQVNALQNLFFEYIGPVAGIVMRECLEKWAKGSGEKKLELTELAAIMRDEVEQSDQGRFEREAAEIIRKG